MSRLFILLAVAAVISALVTPLVARVARWLGAIDRPDGGRKLHAGAIPVWGGIAVFIGFCVAALVGCCILSEPEGQLAGFTLRSLLAAAGICLIGAIDDRWTLRPRTKLLLQIVAVVPLVASGFCITKVTMFGWTLQLGWLGFVVTAFWLIGCINAINLLDGMDGLASLVGLIVAAMTAVIAMLVGNVHIAAVAVCLAGALLGFLVHNLPPARVFLGDSGSMLIGLLLGLLGITSSIKTSTTLTLAVPVLVMSLPILDTLLAIFRRKLSGRGIGEPDRQHIHHRLLERGLSEWQTLFVVGGLCLATGVTSVIATWMRTDKLAWAATAGLLILPVWLGWFGRHELQLLRDTAGKGLAMLHRLVAGPLAAAAASCGLKPRPPGRGAPFAQRWQWLVDQVSTRSVDHIELTVCPKRGTGTLNPASGLGKRHDIREPVPVFGQTLTLNEQPERARRIEWRRAGIDPQLPPAWRIAVSVCGPKGDCCELAFSGAIASDLGDEQHVELAWLAQNATLEFAAIAEIIPGLALIDQTDADAPPPHHRAA